MPDPKEASPLLVSSRVFQTFVLVALIAGAFALGTLWTKVQVLEKGGTSVSDSTNKAPAAVAQPPTKEVKGTVPKITDRDHIRGDKNAQIAIIEYSDLECPFCKTFHPTMKQVVDSYGNKVMWVFRHFPLSFHANAQKEAEASECAWDQGGNDAFWKYVDTIFERTTSNGTGYSLDNLVPLAAEIGLNKDTFKTCLDSGKFAKYVTDEGTGGAAAGVDGTPGNIVLDTKSGKTQMLPGAVPLAQIKQVVDGMLK